MYNVYKLCILRYFLFLSSLKTCFFHKSTYKILCQPGCVLLVFCVLYLLNKQFTVNTIVYDKKPTLGNNWLARYSSYSNYYAGTDLTSVPNVCRVHTGVCEGLGWVFVFCVFLTRGRCVRKYL